MSSPRGLRVGLLSLETWDEIWRRNQHLAARLVADGTIESLLFIAPPIGGLALRARRDAVQPGVELLVPPLLVPRRWGGHRLLALWARRVLRGVDVLWIQDAGAGAAALRRGSRAVYDVTDDWRAMAQTPHERARIIAAEDVLAHRASTVVCSAELARRWVRRYDVRAELITNGVDVEAIRSATPRRLDGPGPHLMYVGTAHPNRVDVALLVELAEQAPGTLHLVGPDGLSDETRARLHAAGAQLHGPVATHDVPSWLVSADVLLCPHLVDEFTRSLDAIKAHEYLAGSCPVVATPSSGFQDVRAPGLTLAGRDEFVAAARAAVGTGPFERPVSADWSVQSQAFGATLVRTAVGVRQPLEVRGPVDRPDHRTWLIVLNWNGRADTLELLAGLTDVEATVVVVDNGSVDGSYTAVRDAFPDVHLLQTGANLGYAGGNNAGIAYALEHGAQVVGVLNNDVLVDPGFLDPLLAELDGRPVAVSSDIRFADDPDVSWFRGSRLDRRAGWPVHLAPHEQPTAGGDVIASPYLTGCCLLADADTWRRVGLFDEGLFLMFEDSDWSARARALGVELLVVPRSTVRHKVSRSFTGAAAIRGRYYFARNGTVFAWRHLGRAAALRFAWRRVLRPSLKEFVDPRTRAGAALSWLGILAAVATQCGPAGPIVTRLAAGAGSSPPRKDPT